LSSLLHLGGTTHAQAGDYPADVWTFDGNSNYNSASGTVHDAIAKANAAFNVTPYKVTYDGNSHTATGTATGVKGEALSGLNLSGTTHSLPGSYLNDPWTFTDTTGNYNNASGSVKDYILFAAGVACNNGLASHIILQPINADGSSVFKMGSTVPTKFVVCDAFGNSVGPNAAFPNSTVVKSYLVAGYNGAVATLDEAVVSTTPDSAFRWDPTAQQWIFNTATGVGNLSAKGTYLLQITLIDGSVIGSSGPNGLIPSGPFAGYTGYEYGLK
jgi:hypothetical protein